jgi:recombinational DNA repair ATPase RecF
VGTATTWAFRCVSVRVRSQATVSWATALCLRLGLARLRDGARTPVLLDDPFSALDPSRQRRAAERLAARGQVFVSVADAAHVPAGRRLSLPRREVRA